VRVVVLQEQQEQQVRQAPLVTLVLLLRLLGPQAQQETLVQEVLLALLL